MKKKNSRYQKCQKKKNKAPITFSQYVIEGCIKYQAPSVRLFKREKYQVLTSFEM